MAFISCIAPSLSSNRSTFVSNPAVSRLSQCYLRSSRCRISPRMAGGPARSTVADTPRKQFLDRFKSLGRVRLVARNNAAIMEAIATFGGLFFASIPSGEYANIVDMSINLDMHLLLAGVSGARFEMGKSRTATKAPTYIIRVLGGDRESIVLSIFLQWDKDPNDIEPERVDAWKQLKADYVDNPGGDTFFFDE